MAAGNIRLAEIDVIHGSDAWSWTAQCHQSDKSDFPEDDVVGAPQAQNAGVWTVEAMPVLIAGETQQDRWPSNIHDWLKNVGDQFSCQNACAQHAQGHPVAQPDQARTRLACVQQHHDDATYDGGGCRQDAVEQRPAEDAPQPYADHRTGTLPTLSAPRTPGHDDETQSRGSSPSPTIFDEYQEYSESAGSQFDTQEYGLYAESQTGSYSLSDQTPRFMKRC